MTLTTLDYIAPGHCTGEPTSRPCKRPRRPIHLCRIGNDAGVGANPRAESDPKASSNLSEGDLRSYRALLAQSDDFKESGPEVGRFARLQ